MQNFTPGEDAFSNLLEGRLAEASPQLDRLAKLARALEPVQRPQPSEQFRTRLRNELLARASESEEDVFAALIDGVQIEAPAGLRPLVAVAAALGPAELPIPSPAFRYSLRNRLVGEATRATRPVGGRVLDRLAAINDRMRRSLRVVVATGVLAALLAGSSAALAASHDALPGQLLYPVKLWHESAQLAVLSGTDEGLRRLEFARTRLEEVRALADAGVANDRLYITTLNRMDTLTETGTAILIEAFRHGGSRQALESIAFFAAAQRQDLIQIIDRLPAGAQPAARDSIVVIERVSQRAVDVLSGCPCSSNALIPAPKAPTDAATTSAPVSCSCQQQQGSATHENEPSTEKTSSASGSGGSTKPPVTEKPSFFKNVPNVPGTTVDNQVEDLIDDVLNQSPVPVQPIPSLPNPLPTASPEHSLPVLP